MERNRQTKIAIVGITVLLLIGLFCWKMNASSDPSENDAALQNQAVQPMTENDPSLISTEDSVVVKEQRTVDIDAVMTEIEASAAGEETVLDEESAEESASVKESQIIMEELGQSYDETSY